MSAGSSLRLVDKTHPVLVFPAAVPSSAAPTYVNLDLYNHVTFVVSTVNDVTGSACALALLQATDSAGTGAKALALPQAWRDIDTAGADTLTNFAVTSDTFSTSATASKSGIYILEVDAAELDVANGFDHVQITIGNSAHQTVTVVAYLSGSRVGSGVAHFPTATN